MTDTLALPKQNYKMPEFIVMAFGQAEAKDVEAIMVIDDWSQSLIEAFTAKDIEEIKAIIVQLGRRHPNSSYMVFSLYIFQILIGHLMLVEDGHALKDDLFPLKNPINAASLASQANALLSLIHKCNTLESAVLDSKKTLDATRLLTKRFYDEAKTESFKVLPDVAETYLGALMALLDIEEDE